MYHMHRHLTETNKGRAKVEKKMVSYLQVKMLIYICNFASYHPFPGFSSVNFTIKHKKHHLSRLDRKTQFLFRIFITLRGTWIPDQAAILLPILSQTFIFSFELIKFYSFN